MSARGPHHLGTLARPKLDIVNRRTERNRFQRKRVTRNDVRFRPGNDCLPDAQPNRCDDVPLLTINVVQQCDQRRAIRIVLDSRNLSRDAGLVTLEVDDAIKPARSASATPNRYVAVVVSSRNPFLRPKQWLVWSISRYLLKREVGLKPPG